MTRLKGRQVLSLILCLVVMLGSFSLVVGAEQTNAADWLAPETPTLAKAVDLPNNAQLPLTNVDCDYQATESGVFCSANTSIGKLSMSSSLLVDGRQYTVLNNVGKPGIQPLPNTDYIIARYERPTYGTYIGLYRSLSRSDLARITVNGQTKYQVTKTPDFFLTHKEERLVVNTGFMAVSRNGIWMVLQTPAGLVRINTTTMDIKPFGPRQEASWYGGQASGQVAISNDGRYVAVNTVFNGTTTPISMNIYDLSTCDMTYDELVGGSKAYCKYHDIWNGYNQTNTNSSDMGVKQHTTNPYILGNIRFVDEGNISFTLLYNKDSAGWQDATYVITSSGVQPHKLGLLGMGDSYISGEGAQNYIKDTDNRPNLCHQSSLSYPFLLGANYFDSYESVACSGAKTEDITSQDPNYRGQAKDGISQGDRDDDLLLRSFKPGYKYQNMFVENYTPQAILLSIGGNNPSDEGVVGANFPGFATVVFNCVLSTHSTCYNSAGDRYQLLAGIYSLFNELVSTYQKVKDASPTTRIYVVGYPQVIKPNGDCAANVHLDNNEALFAQQLIERLNKTIKLAAEKVGVFYVDTQSALDGHRLCESKAPAVNGLTAGQDSFGILGKESYHPTAFGHDLLADAIAHRTAHLTASMPAPNSDATAPTIDPTDPFLIDPLHQQYDAYIHKNSPDMAPDILFQGDSVDVKVDGLSSGTELNGQYRMVIHSDPVDLGSIYADANGNISANITIPATVPPGLHTLHLFGKNFDGRSLDISKQVYVAASPDDYDADGIPNSQEPCVIFDASGQDVDQDGIDDACDPIISEAPTATETTDTSPQSNSATSVYDKELTVTPVNGDTLQLQSSNVSNPRGVAGKTDARPPQVQGATTTSELANDIQAQVVAKRPKSYLPWLWTAIAISIALSLVAKYRSSHKSNSIKE